ncbi:hypothetical protein [Ensifer canadensis]
MDELKEQMQMLRFWASDPETLARLAKQLAQQLGAAAQQFAGGGSSGLAGGGDTAAGAASAATTVASAAMEVNADEMANAGGEEGNSADKTRAIVPCRTRLPRIQLREFGGKLRCEDGCRVQGTCRTAQAIAEESGAGSAR